MLRRTVIGLPLLGLLAFCVPPGNSTGGDAGATTKTQPRPSPNYRPSINVMTEVFEDDFDRDAAPGPAATTPPAVVAVNVDAAGHDRHAPEGSSEHAATSPLPAATNALGPNWRQAETNVWHIENGRLCAQDAHNHGVWLERILPVNARIEFDAISDSPQGDLKAEVWGDGQSHATMVSYTNATSYLAILGGWKNHFHVLARLNEHGTDRKQIVIEPGADDPREQPVHMGHIYRFRIERNDGHTVHLSVNGLPYLDYDDPAPLAGMGHDHFGFNDWEVKVCFDNVKVTPLP